MSYSEQIPMDYGIWTRSPNEYQPGGDMYYREFTKN
jgi:hypothetical protein